MTLVSRRGLGSGLRAPLAWLSDPSLKLLAGCGEEHGGTHEVGFGPVGENGLGWKRREAEKRKS